MKNNPIFGLDKIPIEGLLKQANIERGKDKAYIDELEFQISELNAYIITLKNPSNNKLNRLEEQLSIALKGTKAEKQKVKNELYQDAKLAELIDYKERTDKQIKQLKSQVNSYKGTIKQLVYEIQQLKNKLK